MSKREVRKKRVRYIPMGESKSVIAEKWGMISSWWVLVRWMATLEGVSSSSAENGESERVNAVKCYSIQEKYEKKEKE